MEKAKNLIAFLFQRSGKEKLNEKEIYMTISYELRWLTPEKAKIFLHRCLENGLLKMEEGEYTPNFDYKSMQIPLGFKVDESIVEEEDVFSSVIKEIQKKGMKKEDIFKEIEMLQTKMDVIPEVAALVLARKNGIDVSPFISRVKRIIENM